MADYLAYGFPESTEEKQPIASFKVIPKRANWHMSLFGLNLWEFPLMKRLRGPKWSQVIDPEATTGEPPNLEIDTIHLTKDTPKFAIKLMKSFYFTAEHYENGAWVSAVSGKFEFDPESPLNFLTWDEWDIKNSTDSHKEFKYILDKIAEDGE